MIVSVEDLVDTSDMKMTDEEIYKSLVELGYIEGENNMKKFLILDEYMFKSGPINFSKVVEAESAAEAISMDIPMSEFGFDEPSDIDPMEKKLFEAEARGECTMSTVGVYELTTGINEVELLGKYMDKRREA